MSSDRTVANRQDIIVVGAGSQGAVVVDILQRAHEVGSRDTIIGIVDDTPGRAGSTLLGVPILGPLTVLPDIPHDGVFVAVGDNRARRTLIERLLDAGERLSTLVHPSACIAAGVTVGEGSVVCAGAVIAPLVTIGRGVIVNTKASVDHETVVMDFAHLSAGVTVGGRVRIGEEALIALGASVISGTTVGARTTVGAGAAVVRPIPDDVVAFGVPARIRRSLVR